MSKKPTIKELEQKIGESLQVAAISKNRILRQAFLNSQIAQKNVSGGIKHGYPDNPNFPVSARSLRKAIP